MSNRLNEIVEQYKHLWDGSESGWLLSHLNPSEPAEMAEFAIIHGPTNAILIIEDDEAADEIIRRMREAGVPIISSTVDNEVQDGPPQN